MTEKRKTFGDKLLRNSNGRVTLVEAPNVPIIVWFLSTITSKLTGTGSVHDVTHALAFGALFTWAWLEIFQGTNYLRRLLGVVVMTYLLVTASSLSI